uniref:Transcription factor AP-4 n=1 Tax=Myripristis murdjan TaxID=586833 RepID=A0A667YRB1_9TELE
MEYFMVPAQKVPSLQHFRKTEKEVIGGLCSLANIPLTPETARDQERRIRREIANSNERRRMQSINAGFQSLKTLIPHSDGEKLSKVGHREFLKMPIHKPSDFYCFKIDLLIHSFILHCVCTRCVPWMPSCTQRS